MHILWHSKILFFVQHDSEPRVFTNHVTKIKSFDVLNNLLLIPLSLHLWIKLKKEKKRRLELSTFTTSNFSKHQGYRDKTMATKYNLPPANIYVWNFTFGYCKILGWWKDHRLIYHTLFPSSLINFKQLWPKWKVIVCREKAPKKNYLPQISKPRFDKLTS